MSHISVALIPQYLNVRQRKLGTIIIQTVHILQHDSVDTGSLPMEDFFNAQSKLLSKYPSPAEVPLHHRTNGGGRLYCMVRPSQENLLHLHQLRMAGRRDDSVLYDLSG